MTRAPGLRAATLAVLLTALALHDPAQAQDDATRVQLEQRIRLTARLIADSPSAQRIVASGNTQAVAHLDEGRLHHSLAQDLFAKGDLAGARREVDDALRHLGRARRLVPDAPARQAAARQRYDALLASTERLIEAWRQRAGERSNADLSDLIGAMGLVANARQIAGDGRIEEANELLAKAERHVLDGMTRILHTTTLDYTARFSTPAEEFQYELARQQGFADLLPLAVRELRPAGDAAALIERYAESGQALRAQALQRFDAGDTTQALAHIRNATLFLQRALLASGLVAPTPTGTTP